MKPCIRHIDRKPSQGFTLLELIVGDAVQHGIQEDLIERTRCFYGIRVEQRRGTVLPTNESPEKVE